VLLTWCTAAANTRNGETLLKRPASSGRVTRTQSATPGRSSRSRIRAGARRNTLACSLRPPARVSRSRSVRCSPYRLPTVSRSSTATILRPGRAEADQLVEQCWDAGDDQGNWDYPRPQGVGGLEGKRGRTFAGRVPVPMRPPPRRSASPRTELRPLLAAAPGLALLWSSSATFSTFLGKLTV